jgi:hypothetical protein
MELLREKNYSLYVKLETSNWNIQCTDTHTYIATTKCYSRKEVVVMLELRLSRI